MFDFNEIFKEQLATSKPMTAAGVNSILFMLGHNKTAREVMVESKKLKAKIGKIRLMYYVVNPGVDGKPLKEKLEKTWDDELAELQTTLADYVHMGFDGQIPKFVHKEVK